MTCDSSKGREQSERERARKKGKRGRKLATSIEQAERALRI